MKIEIGAPVKRTLNANERKVLNYLEQGLKPLEICRRMKICFETNWTFNTHDVPVLSYKGIICSIKEKGWEIPGENINRKENETMSATITQEKIEEIRQLRKEGMSIHEIEEKTGISHGTISKYTKKEPAAATTTTDSGCNESNLQSTYIVSPHEEDVKPVEEISSPPAYLSLAADAIWDKINALRKDLEELDNTKKHIAARIDILHEKFIAADDECMYINAQIEALIELITERGNDNE